MSEKEFKSYRFSADSDPSDEMLEHLMGKVAEEVRKSNQEVNATFYENLRRVAEERKSEWK